MNPEPEEAVDPEQPEQLGQDSQEVHDDGQNLDTSKASTSLTRPKRKPKPIDRWTYKKN